jgi:hypothetical protein
MRRASERKGDLGARTAKAAGVDEKEGGEAIGYGDRRGVRARLRYRDGREPKTKKAAKNERADQSPSTAAYILTRPCNGEVRKRKTHVSPRSFIGVRWHNAMESFRPASSVNVSSEATLSVEWKKPARAEYGRRPSTF